MRMTEKIRVIINDVRKKRSGARACFSLSLKIKGEKYEYKTDKVRQQIYARLCSKQDDRQSKNFRKELFGKSAKQGAGLTL